MLDVSRLLATEFRLLRHDRAFAAPGLAELARRRGHEVDGHQNLRAWTA